MKDILAALLLAVLLSGCAPARQITLHNNEDEVSYLYAMDLKAEAGIIYASFEKIRLLGNWRPWPWRRNSRESLSLRFLPQSDGGYAVEERIAPTSVGLYEGDTMLTHGDPPGFPAYWSPRGTTADDGEYARIWEYVRARLDRQTP